MTELRRPVVDVPVAVHGSLDFEELQRLGMSPNEVLDFSANVNPYGPSPTVRTALAGTPVNHYPDRNALALRRALAELLSVFPGQIVVGNGASELIWLTALAFIRHRDSVLVLGPTYSEYARVAQLMCADVTTLQAWSESDFRPDTSAIVRELHRLRPEVVFLCNPNNPTGTVLPPDTIWDLAGTFSETLFVVDEVYHPFAPDLRSAVESGAGNVLVLRSLTKDFGLAGLRLGYAVGPEHLLGRLCQSQPPWSVNALAQAAGVAALGDVSHRDRTLGLLRTAKDVFVSKLRGLGFAPVPSEVPFFLFPVQDSGAFRKTLLGRGILVRDCTSFGLPGYVRIATRLPAENERLLDAILATGLAPCREHREPSLAGGVPCRPGC